MTEVKEPHFFSESEVYARGLGWYRAMFDDAEPGTLKGEASTSYTKLPSYPLVVERMLAAVPNVRLIYLMRHPIDRLISHYVHDWSMGACNRSLDEAVASCPELVEYGRYSFQLQPYLQAFGRDRVLPLFLEHLALDPNGALGKVAEFLGLSEPLSWNEEHSRENASLERTRQTGWRGYVQHARVATVARRLLVPKVYRERIRKRWTIGARPILSDLNRKTLTATFDEDLDKLGDWLGVKLNCMSFSRTVCQGNLGWVQGAG